MPAEIASIIAVADSNDLIVRQSIPGLKEPIIAASNPACAPLNSALAESTPPSMVGATCQGLIKPHCGRERVERRPLGGGRSADRWSHGGYEGVHCDRAGIVV